MGLPTILLIILVVWLFGASLLKLAFWIICVVGAVLVISAALTYFRDKKQLK